MVEMVDTLDLGSRFWGFESLFLYKRIIDKSSIINDKNSNSIIYNVSIIINKLGGVV
jgi:hypothetical protein